MDYKVLSPSTRIAGNYRGFSCCTEKFSYLPEEVIVEAAKISTCRLLKRTEWLPYSYLSVEPRGKNHTDLRKCSLSCSRSR